MAEGSVNITSLLSVIPVGTVLLVPGFIWSSIESRIQPRSKQDKYEKLFRYLFYSLIFYGSWYLIYPESLPRSSDVSLESAFQTALIGVFLLPIAVIGGISTGIFAKKDFIGRALRRAGLHTTTSIDTGWERAFTREWACLVRITYDDGREVFAKYDTNSVVSEPDGHADAFFGEAFVVNADGNLELAIGSVGVWVNASTVREIRFYDIEELDSDEARQLWPKRTDK